MSEGCPNCGQLTNASCSRLIEDTCGHKKCRICLLYEEQGCKICEKEQLVPSIIGNYYYYYFYIFLVLDLSGKFLNF